MRFFQFHYALSLVVTSLSTLILGAFVYLKNRHSIVNRSFFLLSLSMAVWSGFQAGQVAANNKFIAGICSYGEYIGVVFIPSFFLNSIYKLLEIKKEKVLKIGYFLSLFFLLLSPTGLFIKGVDVQSNLPIKFPTEAGLLYPLFLIFFIFYMGSGVIALFKAYKNSTGSRRNQMKYFFWAVVLAITSGSMNFLPVFHLQPFPLLPFVTYGVPIYTLATSYAILRYRLMDITIMITRTVTYGLIYSFSVGVFALLTMFFGQWLVFGKINAPLFGVSMLSILIITLSLRPLDNFLSQITNNYLFRKKYEYQKTLRTASEGMARIKSLPKLLDLIVRMIANSVRVTQATIFLLNKETQAYVAVVSRGKDRVPKGFIRNSVSSPLVSRLLKKKDVLVYDEIMSWLKIEPNLNENLRIILKKISQEMRDLNAAICIPSFIEDKMIGFLMLGEKLSGDMYTQEDLDVFMTLANQAALAIENAQSYEELKDTRDQLLQSERLATIGKFANEVAHEIKNPLQAIKTFMEYLPQKYNDKDFRDKFAKVVSGEIQSIDSFVKQLAGFSKPKPLELSPLDINQVLDTTLMLLEDDCKRKGILIKRAYLKKNIRILADREQMKQVFLNIFLNSLEAMDKTKTNKLIVETNQDDKNLAVKITDTGCGIAKEDLLHLFEPFFTTKENGTGLGLTIVKNIVENHGGKISVESKLTEGTTFSINLPLTDKK